MENKDKFFITRDFYLAAFLRAKDIELIKAVKQNKIITFHFVKNKDIQKTIDNFYNNTEMVSANKFINAIRNLRAYSYNLKEI